MQRTNPEPPAKKPAYAILRGPIPALFDGLVGVYTQDVFRPTHIVLQQCPGVKLLVRGSYVPFEATQHELDSTCSLSVGAFIAFHVKNTDQVARGVDIEVHGVAFTTGEIGRGFMTGLVLPLAPERGEA